MKNVLILLSFILLISCNKNEEFIQIENQTSINSLKYIVAEDVSNFNDLYSQEYTFDINGKVLSETFNNENGHWHNKTCVCNIQFVSVECV